MIATENLNIRNHIKGKFRDIITYEDGRVEVGEWDHNCIINNVVNLITCLFKNQSGYSGLTYWAVGSGLGTWDNTSPTAAVATDTGCVTEIGRIAIPTSGIVFLDTNSNVTASVTNTIQVTVTFATTDCVGTWREFAIFGGNATTTLNSGIAINHKNHAILVKTSSMTVQRQIIFTFS